MLRLSISGLERLRTPERYWLYGQFQLGTPGKGMSSRLPRQSVLASAPCSVMPAEFVVDNYVTSWGLALPAYQVNANLVLLDSYLAVLRYSPAMPPFLESDIDCF